MKRQLSEEARLKRNEYIKNWRRNNKDKVREYNLKHWETLVEREVARRLETAKSDSSEDNIK